MTIRLSSLRRPLAVSAALVLLTAAPARAATQEELEAKINALAMQVAELRSELATLRTQGTASPAATAAASAGPASAISVGAAEGEADGGAKVSWFGYGEFTYSRPKDDGPSTTADMARFVLGAGYRFDDKTRFVS